MKLSSLWMIENRAARLAGEETFWTGQGWGRMAEAMVYNAKDMQIQDLPTGGSWLTVNTVMLQYLQQLNKL